MTKPIRQTTRFWLIAIVVVAACLRFSNLGATGIFGVDDGRYVLDGLSKYNEIHFCAGLVQGKLEELRGGPEFLLSDAVQQGVSELARVHPFSPKLGFSYLTALVMLVAGVRVTAVLWIEAIAGVFMIWAVFALVRAIHNDRAGLIAAAMLAFSNYHLYFSRNAYPQCSSVLLLLLAVMCHLHWQQRAGDKRAAPLLACGAFAGLSFWVHYQAAGALPLLALVHGLVCLREGTVADRLVRFAKGALLVSAGFIAVIVCAEASTYPMIFLFRSQGLRYPQGTFLELLLPRFIAQTSVETNLSGFLLFPFFLDLLEGGFRLAVIVLILILGVVLLAGRVRKDRAWITSLQAYRYLVYLAVPFLIPFLIFSLKTMQGARMFTFVLPFFFAMLAIVAETAWREFSGHRRTLRSAVAVLVVIAAAVGLIQTAEIIGIKSAYPEVIQYLEQQNAPGARAAWSSTLRAYLIEAGLDDDTSLRGDAPYFVTDWQELYYRRYPDETPHAPPGSELAETFDHQFGRVFLEVEAFPSHGPTLENTRWVRNLNLDRARRLLVYQIK